MSDAAGAAPRRSEQCLTADFEVVLLFSDTIEYRLGEVIEALHEEFPGMRGWTAELTADLPMQVGGVVLGEVQNPDPAEGGLIVLSGAPGRYGADLSSALARAAGFRDGGLALRAHRTHLVMTMRPAGSGLAARFRAARALTSLSAVFAALPVCEAVFFATGDVLCAPATWVEAARHAWTDRFPPLAWTSLAHAREANPAGGPPLVSMGTVGTAAFIGTEIVAMPTPMPPAELARLVLGAQWLLLEGGSVFEDGHTMGGEGSDPPTRVRFLAEGPEVPTDRWLLFPPGCAVDDVAFLGPRRTRPGPDGRPMREERGEPGFLSRLLRGRGA